MRRTSPIRTALALVAVVLATLAGGYLAMVSFSQDRTLSVGIVKLSVSPGHKGALDIYAPLVDWGARFEAIRFPARVRAEVRTVNRTVVEKVAAGGRVDVVQARAQARDGLASFLRMLIAIVTLCAAALGALTALALRGRNAPRLRVTLAVALATAGALAVALVVLLPPRGPIDKPQYYAFGSDVPKALEAVESVQRSTKALDEELNAQLVGLARLVVDPANRARIEGRPRLTLASDLHNNVLAIPILERTASKGPVFFDGDLTDRGTPLETALIKRVVRTGKPFVAVSGNHDSDSLMRSVVRAGAIVLTQTGRRKADGSTDGQIVHHIAGVRVAGYSDPFERRSAQDFADRFDKVPAQAQLDAFADWMRPLRGKVDIVMVHEPQLAAKAIEELKQDPPVDPLVLFVGHTHKGLVTRFPGVTVLNGGSVGAGGTGNLTEKNKIGIARFSYEARPRFAPLAADLVEVDPSTGSATARRERLDAPAASGRGA